MPRPRTDIEPRILHAARDRFLHDGVDGASLRAIARAAGTSIGMLYYYFPTKDDLFLAVVEEVYGKLLSDLERALAPAGAPVRERLGRLYARIAATDDDELAVVRMVLREVLVGSPRLARLIERFQRGHLPLVLRTLAQGQAEGAIRTDLPLPLLLLVTFGVGAVPQLVARNLGPLLAPTLELPPPARLAELLLEVLFQGVGQGTPPTDK